MKKRRKLQTIRNNTFLPLVRKEREMKYEENNKIEGERGFYKTVDLGSLWSFAAVC